MTRQSETAVAPLDIIWGVRDIARVLRRSQRSTYHCLEAGTIPGARKMGGRWCFSPALFHAALSA